MSQSLGPPQGNAGPADERPNWGRPDPIEEAIRAGKFSPARRPHYERLMKADPVGTRQLLAELAPVIPVNEIGGVPSATPSGAAPAASAPSGPAEYPRNWLNAKEKARGEASQVVKAED